MSFEIRKITVNSTDNIHTLVGKIYIPNEEIKGLLHIVHGMTEHIDRYDSFMAAMAENGYVCYGYDNLGHGKTAKDDSELGFISHRNGWKYLVNDVAAFTKAVSANYPDKEIYLFGHSMGSFIARIAAENFNNLFTKAIFCGTAGKNPMANMGLLLANTIKFFRGDKYVSKLILNTAFGTYNKRFGNATKYEWLSTDRTVIEKYMADKFCTFDFTVSAMHDLISLIKICNRNEWYKNLNNNMPIFLISGSDDPVGNYGKGINEIYDKLLLNNQKVSMKLYNGYRHEILNDFCKAEVINDILEFLN